MLKKIIGFMLILVVIFANGCRCIPDEQHEMYSQIKSQELGEKFVNSFANNNQKEFIKLLNQDAQNSFNKAQFQNSYKKIITQYGEIEDVEFISFLENPIYIIQIWKIRFNKDGVVNDMLFRVLSTFDEEEQTESIAGFAFI